MTTLIALALAAFSVASTPCPTEDSHNCYFRSANDTGYSFIAVGTEPFTIIIPLPTLGA